MNLTWRLETQVPHGRLIAVVSKDGDGFSARIEGKFVAGARAGASDIADRLIRDEHYGPITVSARSLTKLLQAVERRIENDIGPLNKGTDDPG